MTNVEAGLLGILIGYVLGLVWSDTTSIVRIAYKTRHGGEAVKDVLARDVRHAFSNAIPRWMVLVIGITSAALIVIGATSVWQYNQFSNYQSCVEDRDAVQSTAQDLRTKDLEIKEQAYKDWLDSIVPVFAQDSTAQQQKTFKEKTIAARKAQADYLETVQENPYPEPVQEVCGSVSKGGEAK